jgi:Rps23 Pro-64 3,4-dihydroxylase Tpa1-like proline 4-hydroxylase
MLDRDTIVALIAARLVEESSALAALWRHSTPVRHFYIDDLLPEDFVRELYTHFPPADDLTLRSTLRERKRTGVKVDAYHPSIGDALYAFQDKRVIDAIHNITGIKELEADPTLYASGISVMGPDDYLRPHVDNSHDAERKRYRVLNLLYYVSPNWRLENGGNLELWGSDVREPKVVHAKFNRLMVMQTDRDSLHSVNKVIARSGTRCCVSNYFFSKHPPMVRTIGTSRRSTADRVSRWQGLYCGPTADY